MSADLYRPAEFAKHVGLSRQRIDQLIGKGTLRVDGDGYLNMADPLTIAWMAGRRRPAGSRHKGAQEPAPLPASAASSPAGPPPADHDTGLSRGELQRRKDQALLTKYELGNARLRGELLPRDLVTAYLNRRDAVDVELAQGLPGRIAPSLAALAGTSDPAVMLKIEERLASELYSVLQQAQRATDLWLASLAPAGKESAA